MDKELIKLYKELQSIRKVCNKTGLPLSTAHYKLNKIGILNKQNRIKCLRSNNETLIGTYLGLWAGDGSRFYNRSYTSKIHLDIRNKKLIKFVQNLILELFGKKTWICKDGGNRACVKISSRFIFKFVEDYLEFENKNKTKTIQLKGGQSKKIQRGFFLGLMLSDGHLKKYLQFVSISENLAKNMKKILESFNLSPREYIHKRAKYGWNDLHMISLRKQDSNLALKLLDEILLEINANKTGFYELKNREL